MLQSPTHLPHLTGCQLARQVVQSPVCVRASPPLPYPLRAVQERPQGHRGGARGRARPPRGLCSGRQVGQRRDNKNFRPGEMNLVFFTEKEMFVLKLPSNT